MIESSRKPIIASRIGRSTTTIIENCSVKLDQYYTTLFRPDMGKTILGTAITQNHFKADMLSSYPTMEER